MLRTLQFLIWISLLSLNLSSNLSATSRSTGIGFRGALFQPNDGSGGVVVHAGDGYGSADVRTPGGGASIYFFSRIAANWYLETTIGALGEVEVNATVEDNTQVQTSGIVPFLFGARVDLMPLRFSNKFQPYICGGPGYYMLQETEVSTTGFNSTVGTDISSRFGAYAGAGFYVMFGSWFGLNLDARYHHVGKHKGIDRGGSEFAFGFAFMWGQKREIFEVVDTKIIVSDIYPAYYQFYNTYPVAMVTVRNRVGYPIEVNIKSDIPGVSERQEQSGFVRVDPRETKDIPVHALFGSRLLRTTKREPATIDLKIEARAGTMITKTVSAQITVHSRNGWNGDIDKLGYFVNPESDPIREFSRSIIMEGVTEPDNRKNSVLTARLVFQALGNRKIRYLSDPNIPFYKDDRVQFAESTLELGTGDCDDLVVLYASLLESLGIHTAFVDVQDPEKDTAHLYLLFDSGISPEESELVADNPKRFIVRQNDSGRNSCWIPVETTLIHEGFEQAWQAAALQYLQEAEIRNGQINGWVRIVDLDFEGDRYETF